MEKIEWEDLPLEKPSQTKTNGIIVTAKIVPKPQLFNAYNVPH
jgi:hypothetical protein